MSESISVQMPKYRCHKEVWALKIKEIHPGKRDGKGPGATLIFENNVYAPLFIDESLDNKHNPKEGWYYIVYSDGYVSFSPAKAFEDGYTLIP